jgi:hypothetical protein
MISRTTSRTISYPFIPRSTAYLESGQFWSIPMSNGRFACGRVLQLRVRDGKRDRRELLAGLLEWAGDNPPSFLSIAGARVLTEGAVHVKTIGQNGGAVLGYRPLELDALEPGLSIEHWSGSTFALLKGFEVMRTATLEERLSLPTFSTWGYEVIKILAEKHLRNRP